MSYYSQTDDISFTPLTRKQERALFRVFYAGGKHALRARDEILRRHLKLAAKLALKHAKGALTDEDAISAGNFGLLQALESKCFDPERGWQFASYVRAYIRGQVMTALREQGWKGDIANEVDVTAGGENTLTGHKERSCGARRAMCTFGRAPRNRCLEEETVDAEVENSQLSSVRREQIEKVLGTLPSSESTTIRGFYFRDQNFAEIGRAAGLTREGVRKAHARGMAKLKEALQALKSELC